MGLRQSLVGLAAGSMMLVAGCPLDGFGLGPLDFAIPDGNYAGTLDMYVTVWNEGAIDDEGTDASDVTRTFKTGDLINKVTNDWFYPGDRDTIDLTSLQIAREVSEVEQFDWGYHILFDVTGTWYDVPVSGTQHADYYIESDGSVFVEDTLLVTSLQQYDGGAWEIEVYREGNLERSGGGSSGGNAGNGGSNGGNGLPPWFDEKSGKIRR